MKKYRTIPLSFVALLCLISIPEVFAQTIQRDQANQERMLKDLLDEVRELRAIIQRVDVHTFNTQITINRLRVRQDQVLQLTREIFEVRDRLVEVRTDKRS